MSLSPGVRVGPYEVLAKLGEGGMGEVYRAEDTKLGRKIALKTLPAAFTSDAERVARFRREAQVLAALNHPHIAAIYGLDEADGCHVLVLELADGETLAARLARGPLPVDEALVIARQIADALEAAHEKGIVHRDLKPANVAVNADGLVKVLDFGLAKALEPAAVPAATDPSGNASQPPTITSPALLTGVGVLLGTAAYMAPEQAKGRAADKRSDVWAFGCVLYEMLTGRRAFQGEDVTDTIAAVVRDQPDWTLLPPNLPGHVRLLLTRCLEKDRRARVSDIAVARFLLTESIAAAAPSATSPAFRRPMAIAAACAFGVAMAAIGGWLGARFVSRPRGSPARFILAPPPSQPMLLQGFDRDVVISPDGSEIVYRSFTGSAGGATFAARGINDLADPRVVGGTGGGDPFISPDGQWLGYSANGELRKVSMKGGPPVTICKLPNAARGVHWGPGDRIVFGIVNKGLLSVPAGGGEPQVLTTPAAEKGEFGHYYPFVMPDGRSVLFTIGSGPTTSETGQIAVLNMDTGRYKTVIRGGSAPTFVEPGYLVFATAGTLRAVRFDPRRLEVIGEPVPMVDRLWQPSFGSANYSLSSNGTLVYVPGAVSSGTSIPPRSVVWVDRRGTETTLRLPAKPYGTARLSPDGTRIALDVRSPSSDIWVWDIRRETLTPLHYDAPFDLMPIWTPDSRRIVWSSSRGGGNPNLYWQSADGSGAAERLTNNVTAQFATSVTHDGSRVLVFGTNASSGIGSFASTDLFVLPLDGSTREAVTLLQSPAQKLGAEVSPDGRWLAYQSNEAGQAQVYVRPFPNVDEGRWPISTDGGTRPAWSRNGDELFYLDVNDQLTAVRVRASATQFVSDKPVKILSTKYVAGSTTRGYDLRAYDVAPDGQHFLMLKDPAAGSSSPGPPTMVVVVNWAEELKSRLSPR